MKCIENEQLVSLQLGSHIVYRLLQTKNSSKMPQSNSVFVCDC